MFGFKITAFISKIIIKVHLIIILTIWLSCALSKQRACENVRIVLEVALAALINWTFTHFIILVSFIGLWKSVSLDYERTASE